MSDVPDTGEVTPIVEQSAEQTPVSTESTTEQVDTPTTPEVPVEPDRGDPRIAMQEERRKRQEIEANINNPQWIFDQAQKLGLAVDETPSAPPVPSTPQQPFQGIPDVRSQVEHELDYARTIEKHPEFDRDKGDKGLVMWAATLVNQGHKPSQAVDIINKTIAKQANKLAATEVSTTLESRATSEAQKLNAAAITSTAQASSASDDEELNAAAKDWRNPGKQEAAILEKLKRGAK